MKLKRTYLFGAQSIRKQRPFGLQNGTTQFTMVFKFERSEALNQIRNNVTGTTVGNCVEHQRAGDDCKVAIVYRCQYPP